MKQTRTPAAVALIALLVSLAGCGGGGDQQAGAPTAFNVVPATVTVTAATFANGGPPAGRCVATPVGQFFVYGGAAPYTIANTTPDAMTLSTATVNDTGGSFSVAFTGVCVAPANIVVVDKLNRQFTVTLNNKPAA